MTEVEPKDEQEIEEGEAREYIAVRDALNGETDADNYRHAIVRSEFLKEIWLDEKVQQMVSRWAKLTGLEPLAVRTSRCQSGYIRYRRGSYHRPVVEERVGPATSPTDAGRRQGGVHQRH